MSTSSAAERLDNETEGLYPDLAAHLIESPIGTVLKHPLVFQVPYFSASMANMVFEQKRVQLKESMNAWDWHRAIVLYERPYRANALEMLWYSGAMSRTSFWECARFVWMDSENIWQRKSFWKKVFRKIADEHGTVAQNYFMEDSERSWIEALDTYVTLYRGYQDGLNRAGLSWTTDYATAKRFGERFETADHPAGVVDRRVHKSHIFAGLLGRGEYEVILPIFAEESF